jgi:hypothetical protein
MHFNPVRQVEKHLTQTNFTGTPKMNQQTKEQTPSGISQSHNDCFNDTNTVSSKQNNNQPDFPVVNCKQQNKQGKPVREVHTQNQQFRQFQSVAVRLGV